MHKHDPKPPKRHASLDEQAVDDPLDATTMPRAARSGAPDKGRRVLKQHGAAHQNIKDDRHSAAPGHGRTHLPSPRKKGGAGGRGNWEGPEKPGERAALDEMQPLGEE